MEPCTGCWLSEVVAVVYLFPFSWLGNLDRSSYLCSWGSGHALLGCPPTGCGLGPRYSRCLLLLCFFCCAASPTQLP